VKKWPAVGALWLWVIVIFITHFGAKSPYSYGWAIFHRHSLRLLGTVVNPDADEMVPHTRFFYDGETPRDWSQIPNLRVPYHAFVAATAARFTRSYLASYAIANVGALMLLSLVAINFAIKQRLRAGAAFVAVASIAALPFVATYAGQPMHYVVDVTVSFLAVLALCALDDDDVRNPLVSGMLLAIVLVNYDPYVIAAAIAAYLLFVVRFRRIRDAVAFVLIGVAPALVWTAFLRMVTNDRISPMIRKSFIEPVVNGWIEYVKHPIANALQPFVMGEIGLRIAFSMVVSMIDWPLLLLCLAGVWRLRNDIPRTRIAAMVSLLLLLFVLHQIGTAGFDWENNPRRAFPVILATGLVYGWVVDRLWDRRAWRAAFIAVLAICGVLAMADTLFRTPVVQYLSTQQAMHSDAKEALAVSSMRFETMPELMSDTGPVWHDLPRARHISIPFVIAQLFAASMCIALMWLLARGRLLPRIAPVVATAVWVLSFAV